MLPRPAGWRAALPTLVCVGLRPGAPPISPENELHVDADLVCPRCLRWIERTDFVRRNGIGLAQHESCPPETRRRG